MPAPRSAGRMASPFDFPSPLDMAEHFPSLRLNCELRISLPNIGMNGLGHFMAAINMKYKAVNVYDKDASLAPYLRHLLGGEAKLNLGAKNGDINGVEVSELEDSEGLVGSFHFQARSAARGGWVDYRKDCAYTMVRWVKELGERRKVLKFFAMEHLFGITHVKQGDDFSYLDILRKYCDEQIPHFTTQVWEVHAEEQLLPQKPKRIYIVGLHRSLAAVPNDMPLEPVALPLPPTVPNFRLDMFMFLNKSLPNIQQGDLPTDRMKQNYKEYMDWLEEMYVSPGGSTLGDSAIFDLGRRPGKHFADLSVDGLCPTIGSTNKYLFIVSLRDFDKEDPTGMEVHRFVHDYELATFQGFRATDISFAPPRILRQAVGTASPPHMMGTVFYTLMQRWALFTDSDSESDATEVEPVAEATDPAESQEIANGKENIANNHPDGSGEQLPLAKSKEGDMRARLDGYAKVETIRESKSKNVYNRTPAAVIEQLNKFRHGKAVMDTLGGQLVMHSEVQLNKPIMSEPGFGLFLPVPPPGYPRDGLFAARCLGCGQVEFIPVIENGLLKGCVQVSRCTPAANGPPTMPAAASVSSGSASSSSGSSGSSAASGANTLGTDPVVPRVDQEPKCKRQLSRIWAEDALNPFKKSKDF